MNPLVLIGLCATGLLGAAGLWSTNELDLAGPQAVASTVYPHAVEALPASITTVAYSGPGCTEYALEALAAGFTPAELPIILTIIELESMCLPHVVGDNGLSYGLAQIHAPSWVRPNRWNPQGYLRARGLINAEDELLNPAINLQAAWWVYVEGGWEQWTTYNRALEILQ